MGPLEPDVRDAYLRRLALEAEPPSTDALVRLHRSHTERVPYETMWIQGDERWGIDPRPIPVRSRRVWRAAGGCMWWRFLVTGSSRATGGC